MSYSRKGAPPSGKNISLFPDESDSLPWGRNCVVLAFGADEVIVTKNGKEVGRLIPKDAAISYLTDSLAGILKGNYDLSEVRKERLRTKYETAD